MDVVAPHWDWWHLALYMTGLLTQRGWEIAKWKRDRKREGRENSLVEYFSHYPFIAVITLIVAASFFWVWASESMQLTAFGLEMHIPFVPEFSFVMGFFSDGFAIYFVKTLRNLTNRMTGAPL